jgi:Transposase, Mutator family
MPNVVKTISAHLTTLKGSVDDGFVHKLLYIGEPLEARAIVLQDGWCSKSTYRKGATMTKDHRRVDAGTAQEILLDDPGFLREIAERVVQQILEAEMTEHIGAAPYERGSSRSVHCNGHKPRALRTRVGTLNLLVPQDREGTFSTRLFSRYQRNEKALCLALMEMNVEGVSTRKVKEITEELCGTSFSKSLISSLAGTGSTGLQYIGPAFMIRHCSYSAFYLQMSENQRADERTRTADLISLRVIGQGLQGVAQACRTRISKGVSFLRIAVC